MHFRITKRSKRSNGRRGILTTAHGRIPTPFFMPIATRGAVKALTSADLKKLGADILLSNTYHLWQRPRLEVIRRAGGLHEFMQWDGPILTDSGGYQVFSLARRRKITETGVTFSSEIDGRQLVLTPELAIKIQRTLGSDILMSFDECTPYPCSRAAARRSLELTTRWAERGQKAFRRSNPRTQLLFGIVQGSVYKELRLQSARDLVAMDFDGYSIGGLAVGEPAAAMVAVLDYTVPELPASKPRYLMGVGKPEQIVEAVRRGIDMFDCVIPTRNARHGQLYVWKRSDLKSGFVREIRITQARYARDMKPLDPRCSCPTCRTYSRAYLRHLYQSRDPLAYRLGTLHNLSVYITLMEKIRSAIQNGTL